MGFNSGFKWLKTRHFTPGGKIPGNQWRGSFGGFLSRSGRFWEEVNFVLLPGIESKLLERSAYTPVTIPTILARLHEVSLTFLKTKHICFIYKESVRTAL